MSVSGRSGGSQDTVSFSIQAIMALAKKQNNPPAQAAEIVAPLAATQAADNFAKLYAQHAADGVVGRFYKGTDVVAWTAGMDGDQKASFLEAYNNHTLNIQKFEDAGVKTTGSLDETITVQGMSIGGGGTCDATAISSKYKYVSTVPDPMFGGYVVSWGGPPSKQ